MEYSDEYIRNCYSDSIRLTKLIISKGAEINARTDSGITALYIAKNHYNDTKEMREMIEFLISMGATE